MPSQQKSRESPWNPVGGIIKICAGAGLLVFELCEEIGTIALRTYMFFCMFDIFGDLYI